MSRILRLWLAIAVFACLVASVNAQKNSDRWLRVITGDDSIVDLDKTSLVLEPGRAFRADFRTTLLKDEPIPEITDGKYLARLDSIEFKDGKYRILKSTLFDSSGKIVLSSQPRNTNDWKPGAYGFYRAAAQLAPFGRWTIKSYRYASGETPRKDDPPELKSLIGSELSLYLDNVHISDKTCYQATFEPLTIRSEEFLKKFGTPLTTLGIQTSQIDALMLSCETVTTVDSSEPADYPTLKPRGASPSTKYTIVKRSNPKDFPEQTLILRLDNRTSLMLWDGVFLEIERPGNLFLP